MAASTSSGRRRARVPGGRTVRVVVRVTPAEYAELTGHAHRGGLTVPSYLADLGLHPDTVPAAELRAALTHAAALRRQLAAVAARLDQLASDGGTSNGEAALSEVLRILADVGQRAAHAATALVSAGGDHQRPRGERDRS